MSLTRLVQISAGGTHLVSVPAEVVGSKHGRPLEAVWKYRRVKSLNGSLSLSFNHCL